jgi:hydroxyethylthiazole kinase-like uncharacterized protein yjeF
MAALRVGAGLVTLGCPPEALTENAAQMTSVMVRSIRGSAGLEDALADPRLNAMCLGPGLGQGTEPRNMVRVALATRRPVVLDADALSSFATAPRALFVLLHGTAILTPHLGEFTRLFREQADGLKDAGLDDRRAAVRAAAARCGAVVLLKGPVTLAADPAGHMTELHLTGSNAVPWLATGGTGDVLAGLLTGLLARGFSPLQATEAGAWLHAAAARLAGPGLIAEDLPGLLPTVFTDLGL